MDSKNIIIAVLGITVIIFVGAVGYLISNKTETPQEIVETTNGEWLTYTWDNTTIQYPADWVLEEEKYLTPAQEDAGEKPSVIGFSLKPKEQKSPQDEIRAGGRQIDCSNFDVQYKCSTLDKITPIYTNSNNADVLSVYEVLLNTEERIKNIVEYSAKDIKYFQDSVQQGIQMWWKNPLEVAKRIAPQYGFDYNDEFVVKSQAASAGIAEIQAKHNNQQYLITLLRYGDIWLIDSMKKQ